MELSEKQIKRLQKLAKFDEDKDLATIENLMELDEKIEDVKEHLDIKFTSLQEELKKKLESELVLEIDREELRGDPGEPGKPGKNYILTNLDKKEIARNIDVPVVKQIIEKTEVIHETPVITEITKEVENKDSGEQIILKINEDETSLIKKEKIDGLEKDLKELKERPPVTQIIQQGGASGLERVNTKQGIHTIDFGTNLTVTPTVNGVRVDADNQTSPTPDLQDVTDIGATTTHTLTAGTGETFTITPPATGTAVDSLTSGGYNRDGSTFNYRVYSYNNDTNQKVVSATYKAITFTESYGALGYPVSTSIGVNFSGSGYTNAYRNAQIYAYKEINGVKYFALTPGSAYYYGYYSTPIGLDWSWDAVTEADGYLILDTGMMEWIYVVGTNTLSDNNTGWDSSTFPDVYTNQLGTSMNVNISWDAVAGADGYIILSDTPGFASYAYYQEKTTTSLTDSATNWQTSPVITPTTGYDGTHTFYGELRTNQVNWLGTPAIMGDDVKYMTFTPTGVSIGKNTQAYDGQTVIGVGALSLATEANETVIQDTVAIGQNAGHNVAADNRSVFIGKNAGYNVTNSQNVVAIGYGANYQGGSTSQSNVCIGNAAGYNAQGSNNVYIGDLAGAQVATSLGNNNVGIGTGVLRAITTGSSNLALGVSAGQLLTTGGSNTLLGVSSGQSLTTGSFNLCMGSGSGTALSTAGFNVHLGYFAGHNQTMNDSYSGTFNNGNIAYANTIGNFAVCHTYRGLTIGTSVGASTGPSNFGIGLTQPLYRGHFNGNVMISDTDSSFLGTEKIFNIGFSGATNWTTGTGWTITGGVANKNADGTGTLSQTIINMVSIPVVGEFYVLNFTLAFTSGTVQVSGFGVNFNETVNGAYNTSSRYQVIFRCTSASSPLTFTPSNTSRFTVDNVSLKKCTGGDLYLGNDLYIQDGGQIISTTAIDLAGGIKKKYVAKTANYTLTSNDYLVDCTSNSFTLTLPTAVGATGQQYVLKNSGTGVITLATTSSQTIDGVASGILTLVQWDSLIVVSNNANWIIIN